MKNFLIVLVVVTVFSCESAKKEGVAITGKVENPIQGELVVVNRFESDGVKPIDTLEIASSGAFEFYLKVEEPTFYRLNFYNRQQINLVLDGSEEQVQILLEGDNPRGEVSIEGSKHTNYVLQLEGFLRDQQQDVQDINQQAIEARNNNDTEAMQRITQEYFDLVRVSQRDIKDYIWKIAPSLASIYGLEALQMDQHFSFYDSIAQKFNQDLPDHFFTKELSRQVESSRRLAVGAMAPEIELPNPDGKTISLSSLRGNYVLIDFWAAWCRPCRSENPNVVRVYNKYSKQNFEILGVSLDRNREAWIGAIQQDGLPWKHVSDLKYFNSEAARIYQISSIPATYLISPEGKIIAKGLRGPSLEAKLREIFG